MHNPADYQHLDDATRGVIASSLHGYALEALVRQSVGYSDTKMLEAIRQAGGFRIQVQDLLEPRLASNPVMSPDIAPIADAMGDALFSLSLTEAFWPLWGIDKPETRGMVSSTGVDVTMKDFIGTVIGEQVSDLHRIRAMSATLRDEKVFLRHRRDATLGALASLAAATNHFDAMRLVLDAAQVMPGALQFFCKAERLKSPDQADLEVSPMGWAIRNGSLHVMAEWLKRDPCALDHPVARYKKDGSDEWVPLYAGPFIELVCSIIAPSPMLMQVVLDGMGDEAMAFKGVHTGWLEQFLISKASHDWAHLAPVCLEYGVFDLNVERSRQYAAFYALYPLLERLCENGHMKYHESVGPVGKSSLAIGHPIRVLTNVNLPDWSLEDADACLVACLRDMKRRGVVDHVLDRQAGMRGRAVEMVVASDLPRSLTEMLKMGLDPRGLALSGKTYLELAAEHGSWRCQRVLHSAIAHAFAADAIADLERAPGVDP